MPDVLRVSTTELDIGLPARQDWVQVLEDSFNSGL